MKWRLWSRRYGLRWDWRAADGSCGSAWILLAEPSSGIQRSQACTTTVAARLPCLGWAPALGASGQSGRGTPAGSSTEKGGRSPESKGRWKAAPQIATPSKVDCGAGPRTSPGLPPLTVWRERETLHQRAHRRQQKSPQAPGNRPCIDRSSSLPFGSGVAAGLKFGGAVQCLRARSLWGDPYRRNQISYLVLKYQRSDCLTDPWFTAR